jgi:hypothetical protein
MANKRPWIIFIFQKMFGSGFAFKIQILNLFCEVDLPNFLKTFSNCPSSIAAMLIFHGFQNVLLVGSPLSVSHDFPRNLSNVA